MIKFGTIGTSAIVEKFADALIKHENTSIDVVSSRTAENGTKFAQKMGIEPTIITDWKQLVGKVEAVYIGTPNGTHYEIAKYLLENGLHIIVEKTATFKVEQWDELIKIAKTKQLILLEAFRPVHYPQYEYLKDFVNEYDVTTANLSMSSYSRVMDEVLAGGQPAGFDPNLGRGTIYDMLVYPVELAIDLFGPIKHMKAMRRNLDNEVSVIATMLLEHENGILTTINNSKMSYSMIGNEISTINKTNLWFDKVGDMSSIKTYTWVEKNKVDVNEIFKSKGENDMIYELNSFVNLIEMKNYEGRDRWLELTRQSINVLEHADQNKDF